MKHKVFIDGSEGTTGLQIHERLSARRDIELLRIESHSRKDKEVRKRFLNEADMVFLCLPDDAAREAVSLIENEKVRVIDASTAHRTIWTYGFPELSPQHREAIKTARRVANPGCHASGFIAAVYPLRAAGLLPGEAMLSCFSITGYSGGGKKMISDYEAADRNELMASPQSYATAQNHKHLPEIARLCDLEALPVFCPVISDIYSGMAVTVPLHSAQLRGNPGADEIFEMLSRHYENQRFISVSRSGESDKIAATTLCGTNNMVLFVGGNSERITITAVFDNLGKGASGAAVQNMNLMLSLPEGAGLDKGESA